MDVSRATDVALALYERGDMDNLEAFLRNIRAVDQLDYAAVMVALLIYRDEMARERNLNAPPT